MPRLQKVWLPIALAALAPAAGRAADDAVKQSISVAVSGRDSAGTEVDRYQVTANYTWETGRRGSLSVHLPWQSVSTKTNGVSNSASGLMDAGVTFQFGKSEGGQGQSSYWAINLNLPVGKDSLGASELAAVTALNASAESFLAPQFGRGFAAGIQKYWSKERGNAKLSWYLGYQEESSYKVAEFAGTVIENSGIDTYRAGISRNWSQGRLDFKLGLDVIAFDSSQTLTNGVGTKRESDPNYILSLGVNQAHTDRIKSQYQLTYQIRDKQDSLSPGIVNNLRSFELGNRLFFAWHLIKSNTPNAQWRFGFSGVNSEANKQVATLVPTTPIGQLGGTTRTEFSGSIGYTRNLPNNGAWDVGTMIGISSDAPDYVFRTGYSRKF